MTDVPSYPRISVVVPNYNGAATIGATLDSLVKQQYPDLEIIVVDGGSTDHSVEIIREYAQHISWWVSERDRGQSDAINKGFARCTGDVVNWLCSDDLLLPGALLEVGRVFAGSPGTDVVVGGVREVFVRLGRTVERFTTPKDIYVIPCASFIPQPSCFYRRRLLNRSPPLDTTYHYAMDLELWAYFKSRGATWRCIPQLLSVYPHSGQNKTSVGGSKVADEIERVYNTYVHERVPLTYWHRRLRYPIERLRRRHPGRIWFAFLRPIQLITVLALAPFYGLSRVRAMNWIGWVDDE